MQHALKFSITTLVIRTRATSARLVDAVLTVFAKMAGPGALISVLYRRLDRNDALCGQLEAMADRIDDQIDAVDAASDKIEAEIEALYRALDKTVG